MTDRMPAEWVAHMGDDAKAMHEDMKALANIITLHTSFTLAPEDSAEEEAAGDALEQILNALVEKPEKCLDLLTAVFALIDHMRTGHKFLDFFKVAGVPIIPIINTETGEQG